MGENDRIDLPCGNRGVAPVSLAPFFGTLKQTTVDEDLKSILPRRIASVDQVFRTCDRAGSAQKLDISQSPPPHANE